MALLVSDEHPRQTGIPIPEQPMHVGTNKGNADSDATQNIQLQVFRGPIGDDTAQITKLGDKWY